jgi:pyrimidine deaminase RibD-like protein
MGVSGEGFEVYPVMSEGLAEGQDRWGNFDPPGPESPPTMPAGTLRVDVSDVYDWYKLGQHISNMKGLGKHDFGKGPPGAIISFGDEDLEHQYIQALKKTGLTTTDIDPVDPNQPAGMPKQKTDPTYNVSEADASDYEIHDRAKLDRVLAKCCRMVVKGQQRDSERFGQVAACVINPDNRMIYGINLPGPDGSRRHAERVAIDKYTKSIGEIPKGSIVVTTCSPCNSPMEERSGESCKDLLNSVGIHKVYAGYEDPTQHDDSDADFRVYVTENDQLWGECQLFAQTFLGVEELPEAFDQPYKTKSEKSEYGDVDMLAKLPDGSNLSIMFSRENAENDTWGVEFYRNNSQEVTGEGDAQRVFATVLTAIQKFIKKNKPQKLFFSASKEVEPDQNSESRAKLYDRLVQRYAKAWGYRAFRADNGALVRYELSRLQPVAENFADGRNPQDKGDSKRHGVPTKASVSTLRKVAKQGGRKGQLAHWMANMKAGRAKARRK